MTWFCPIVQWCGKDEGKREVAEKKVGEGVRGKTAHEKGKNDTREKNKGDKKVTKNGGKRERMNKEKQTKNPDLIALRGIYRLRFT